MKNSVLAKMLEQYEEIKKKRESSNSGFDSKNYFTIFIPKDVKTAEKTIRILPPKSDNESPFTEIYVHTKEIDGTKRKFICLKQMFNEPCPFCEVGRLLYERNEEGDRELAKNYYPRLMYVCRVIDRDAEQEGVKFWRFNEDYRNQGIMDKIMAIVKKKGDITDPDEGRDINIHVGRDQNDNVIITSITYDDPSPLHVDKELANKWLTDSKDWKDVYPVKPYDYLEIILKGGIPYWDDEKKCYVDKKDVDEQSIEERDKVKEELERKFQQHIQKIKGEADIVGEKKDIKSAISTAFEQENKQNIENVVDEETDLNIGFNDDDIIDDVDASTINDLDDLPF